MGRLGEESWLTVVIEFEKSATAFALRLDHEWWGYFEDALFVEEFAEGA